MNRCLIFGLFFIFFFLFFFFPCLSLLYFQLSGVIEVSSIRTLFIFFVPFSCLSYSSRFFQLRFHFLFLPSLLSSVSNSPTLSRYGSLPVRLALSLSNEIAFRGCVTMGSPCNPGFSPLSLVVLTWLRTGLKAFLVVTFQQTSLCLLSRILLRLYPVNCIAI